MKGSGLRESAFKESISHDVHNIIAAGANTTDMAGAINRVIQLKGRISYGLPLPAGGLMTMS